MGRGEEGLEFLGVGGTERDTQPAGQRGSAATELLGGSLALHGGVGGGPAARH